MKHGEAVPTRLSLPFHAVPWAQHGEASFNTTSLSACRPTQIASSMFVGASITIGSVLAALLTTMCCFFGGRRLAEQEAKKQERLVAQAERAAQGGEGAHTLCRLSSGSGVSSVPLRRDSLREPLLQPILEDVSNAAADALPPQQLEEVPLCVQRYLARAVRDSCSLKLITLHQIGRLKLDLTGGWKEATATQARCRALTAPCCHACCVGACFSTCPGLQPPQLAFVVGCLGSSTSRVGLPPGPSRRQPAARLPAGACVHVVRQRPAGAAGQPARLRLACRGPRSLPVAPVGLPARGGRRGQGGGPVAAGALAGR